MVLIRRPSLTTIHLGSQPGRLVHQKRQAVDGSVASSADLATVRLRCRLGGDLSWARFGCTVIRRSPAVFEPVQVGSDLRGFGGARS